MRLLKKAAAFFSKPIDITSNNPLSFTDRFSGEYVSRDTVIALSSVWACVRLLATSQSTLPCMVYKTDEKGARNPAKSHRLYSILHDRPNYEQTAVDFWEYMAVSIELWGNAYAKIEKNALGDVVALTPLRPDAVYVTRDSAGGIVYRWSSRGNSYEEKEDHIFHIRGFGGDPIGGLSTIEYGRKVFGAAQAAEIAASSSFKNGMRPSGTLTFPNSLSAEQREFANSQLLDKFTGSLSSGKPMILEAGVEYKQISINPDDAQLLESRGFSVEEVCRMFGVPPFMIGHTEKTTSWGTGIEQQTIGFVKFALRPRLKKIEQEIEKSLLSLKDRSEGLTVEFNLEGFLRGDTAGRAAFYQTMTQIGAMTINEVRRFENLPPVDGGDQPRMQMQNIPITQDAGAKNEI